MTTPHLPRIIEPRGGLDRVLLLGLLVSAMLHGGMLYGAHRWGDCLCTFGKVVCPKIERNCQPRVDLKLVERKLEQPPKPPSPPPPKPKPKPSVIVEKPKPQRPPAAPKAGKVVLPDEALKPAPSRRADITIDRPSLPPEAVVKQSEARAPVIATGEIFGRADWLTPGESGQYGLGGTGKGTGIGPFGTAADGGGSQGSAVVAPPPPPPKPEPPPKAKGPSRPPKVLNWTDPPYPDHARQQGIEGTVVLKLIVTEDGRPANITVARSSGHTALDQAAIRHVKPVRFSPALDEGRPVPMTITFRVRFRLVNT